MSPGRICSPAASRRRSARWTTSVSAQPVPSGSGSAKDLGEVETDRRAPEELERHLLDRGPVGVVFEDRVDMGPGVLADDQVARLEAGVGLPDRPELVVVLVRDHERLLVAEPERHPLEDRPAQVDQLPVRASSCSPRTGNTPGPGACATWRACSNDASRPLPTQIGFHGSRA